MVGDSGSPVEDDPSPTSPSGNPYSFNERPGKLSSDASDRRSSPHLLYGFLTTEANAVVKPIHPKAMPVILTTDEEREVWMRARPRTRSTGPRSNLALTIL
jgi:putative SOS response-associated peptidase YedK